MSAPPEPPSLRLYRALLRLLPREMREEYGDDIARMAAEELDAARARGTLGWLAAWLAATRDIVRRAPYEHWRRRHRLRPHTDAHEQIMQSFLSDLRFAARSFGRQKGATALVLLTLTLAVAANTAVFTLLNALFFRPFPFPESNRLVYLNEQAPKWNLEFTGINYPDFDAWRKGTHTFEAMGLFDGASVNLATGATVDRVQGARVTYDFPAALSIKPVLGRFFTRDEDRPKGPQVVVIGYGLWRSRFAGARDVVGQSLRINSLPFTIIGVLPREADFPGGVQLWLPLGGDPDQPYQSYSYSGIARLKPGVTVEEARRDLLEAHLPVWQKGDTGHVVSPRIMPLRDRYIADFRAMGKALGAAVVLVLLIACANVAGAMLARAIFRQREIGIRMALGASASRVGRQLLTESLALAAVAGAAGTLLGWWGLRVLVRSAPDQLPAWARLDADVRTIAFSVAIVGVTAMLFGLVPALQMRRQDVRSALGAGGGAGARTSGSVPQRRMLDALVVIEIALAAVLLAGGGLLARAYSNLRDIDPGFRVDGVASFRVSLPAAKYPNGNAQRAFYDRLLERMRALHGVTGVGAITCPPLDCHWGNFFRAEGAPPPAPNEADPVVLTRLATPSYFSTMGIKLLRGRFFAEGEGRPDGFRPAVINDLLARRLWPNVADPVGRRFESHGDPQHHWMTVVGVVKDARHYGLSEPMRPGLYLSTALIDSSENFPSLAFVARTAGDPHALFAPLRAIVHEIDPELPLFDVKTMRAALDDSLAIRRAMAIALVAFAAIALTLAVGGIYAVLSYVVGRRRHEIGIRMALGAQRAQVVRLVVRQGLRLVVAGLVIGLPVALLASGVLSTLLVDVSARDPLTYVSVAAVLALTGVAAALVPARRAAKVDPRVSLAEEA